jgi:hypothetical protein
MHAREARPPGPLSTVTGVHPVPLFAVSLLALVAVSGSAAAVQHGVPTIHEDDWIVSEDETLESEAHRVRGSLVVTDGATLTAKGSTLSIGDRLVVHEEAMLVTTGSAGERSELEPFSEEQGFWAQINGTWKARGQDSTFVTGLEGSGLGSVVHGGGGIQVRGDADLQGVEVTNGTAGLTVRRGANTTILGSTFSDLGNVAIGVLGNVTVRGSHVEEAGMGITGRKTCDITVANSTVHAYSNNLLVNGCPLEVTSSRLIEGGTPLTVNAEASLDARNVTLSGYGSDGVFAKALPGSEEGTFLRPAIQLSDVRFDPGPNASKGMEVWSANKLLLENVSIRGHAEHGIETHSTPLELRGGEVAGNGGYGLRAVRGNVTGIETVDWGHGAGSSPPNAQAPVSHPVVVTAGAHAPDGEGGYEHVPGLNLTIRGDEATEPLASGDAGNESPLRLVVETYGTDDDGTYRYLGPFYYTARHPGLAQPETGRIDLDDPTIVVEVDAGQESTVRTSGVSSTLGVVSLLAAACWAARGRSS